MPYLLKIERTISPVAYLYGTGNEHIVEDKQGLVRALKTLPGQTELLFTLKEVSGGYEINSLTGPKRRLSQAEQFTIQNFNFSFFYISDQAVHLHMDLCREVAEAES